MQYAQGLSWTLACAAFAALAKQPRDAAFLSQAAGAYAQASRAVLGRQLAGAAGCVGLARTNPAAAAGVLLTLGPAGRAG